MLIIGKDGKVIAAHALQRSSFTPSGGSQSCTRSALYANDVEGPALEKSWQGLLTDLSVNRRASFLLLRCAKHFVEAERSC